MYSVNYCFRSATATPAFGMGDNPPVKMPEVRLRMLVNCCRKIQATAAGDGHDEILLFLNKDTGNYEIHKFNMQPGCPETHHAFLSDKTVYDKVIEKIKETGIASYENFLWKNRICCIPSDRYWAAVSIRKKK